MATRVGAQPLHREEHDQRSFRHAPGQPGTLLVEGTYSLADNRIAFAARDSRQIRTAVPDAQATARSSILVASPRAASASAVRRRAT
jgi:hypothetical protein